MTDTTATCDSCGATREINASTPCECGEVKTTIQVVADEGLSLSDGTEPTPSTVEARLGGVFIGEPLTINDVRISPTTDGLRLRSDAATGTGSDYLDAEQRIQEIAESVSVLHHLLEAPDVDRSNYPSDMTSSFLVNRAIIDPTQLTAVDAALRANAIYRPIVRVIQRADQSQLWVDRFILQWMAFNTLYNDPTIGREQAQIDSYMTRLLFTDAEVQNWVATALSSNALDPLLNSGLTLRTGSAHPNPVGELNAAVTTVRNTSTGYLDVCRAMLLTIYALRCEIFHGHRAPLQASIAEPLISSASVGLDFILRASVQKHLGLPVTGPLSTFIQNVQLRLGR